MKTKNIIVFDTTLRDGEQSPGVLMSVEDKVNIAVQLEKWLKTFDDVETIFKSDTNFVFIKLSCKANIFAIKLEKEFNIKIKAMSGKFENYCRISVL